jgi:hypothetical protein
MADGQNRLQKSVNDDGSDGGIGRGRAATAAIALAPGFLGTHATSAMFLNVLKLCEAFWPFTSFYSNERSGQNQT